MYPVGIPKIRISRISLILPSDTAHVRTDVSLPSLPMQGRQRCPAQRGVLRGITAECRPHAYRGRVHAAPRRTVTIPFELA